MAACASRPTPRSAERACGSWSTSALATRLNRASPSLNSPSSWICRHRVFAPILREAVIAEKFEAMVKLGRANSRMKDFYDLWLLSRAYEFDGDALGARHCRFHLLRGARRPFPSSDPMASRAHSGAIPLSKANGLGSPRTSAPIWLLRLPTLSRTSPLS